MAGWRRGLAVIGRVSGYLLVQLRHGHPRDDATGPARLEALLLSLGGVYVKLGQLLSLQPDVLPRAYCNALFGLLDRLPKASASAIAEVIATELGRDPANCFDTFEEEPIASASVAQVHVATLAGRRLAVKVRRPGVAEAFEDDLSLIRFVSRWIRRLRLRGLYWLARVGDELDQWTREELDFRAEARYLRALGRLTASSPIQKLPDLIAELSTERVLVTEFLEGPTLLEYIRGLEGEGPGLPQGEIERLGFDPEIFARRVVESFVGNAFENGLFHADLHPANLLILPDNVIGFVDFGITGALSLHARRRIVGLIFAITEGDAERLVDNLFEISTFDHGANPRAFREEMGRVMESWFDPDSPERRLRAPFTVIMLDILTISRRCGILATPDSVRYLRSVIGAEGLIRRFSPRFDVAVALARVCEDHLAVQVIRDRFDVGKTAELVSVVARALPRLPLALGRILKTGAEDSRAGAKGRDPSDSELRGGARAGVSKRSLGLAAIALGLSLLVASIEDPVPGLNLFTAMSLGAVVCWLVWPRWSR